MSMKELTTSIFNDYTIELIIAASIIFLILLFIASRFIKRLRLRRQIKKYRRNRKKKYSGERLLKKIEKKRKKNTNTYKHLKRKGKTLVDGYFHYKEKELIDTAKYVNSEGIKKIKADFDLVIREGQTVTEVIKHKHFIKKVKQLSNTYECLDQVIFFLDHLPKQMLEEKLFNVNLTESITITYDIK